MGARRPRRRRLRGAAGHPPGDRLLRHRGGRPGRAARRGRPADRDGLPEGFLQASRALAEAGGGSGVSFGHVNDDSQGWRLFWMLYNQTGASLDLPEGGPAGLDRDAALRVYAFLADLFDGRTSEPDLTYPTALAAFASGRSAMLICGEWELPYLLEHVEDLGAAPFPTVFDRPGGYADSHAFVLPRQGTPARSGRAPPTSSSRSWCATA
ncbi:hypothetical protein ACFQXA_09580 [Nocardiopsis composta]